MINAVDARTLARSILEARREGRKLKPLTNTRLISADDALKIQDALIDLRLANGEEILGWALIDGVHVSPLMTNSVVDDRVVMGIPSAAVDVRVEPVLVISDQVRLGLRAMDRVIAGALTEDLIAGAHGLVTLAQGDLLGDSEFELRTSRTKEKISVDIESIKTKISNLLAERGRAFTDGQLLVSQALLPGDPLHRGEEVLLQAFIEGSEARCSLRHL